MTRNPTQEELLAVNGRRRTLNIENMNPGERDGFYAPHFGTKVCDLIAGEMW